MLVFTSDRSNAVSDVAVDSTSPPLHWRALRIDAKAALPIEDVVVVAGIGASTVRQLTCLGGRVKPSPHSLLLVLPLPAATTVADCTTAASPAIQVLEIGECAVQLLHDVKACFPSLVRKNPLANVNADDDSDENENSDSEEASHAQSTKRRRTQDKTDANAQAQAETLARAAAAAAAIAPFLAATRVRVLPSMAALHEVYTFESDTLVHAIERDVTLQHSTLPHHLHHIHFLCIEFPAHAPTTTMPDTLNFGVVFSHQRDPQASHFLQIPLPRPPRDFFSTTSEDASEPEVYQDATVFTFNSKREASDHGGGKTAAETVKNIRLRHASGTFCTLVYPTMAWDDVSHKYGAALPQLCALQGELRSRRFMGYVPNRPVEILLETSIE